MKYFILLITLFLSSCETPSVFSPQSIQVSGEYTQTNTGQTLPERVGSFTRVGITSYNSENSDIGAGYNHSSLPIALTLYIYPAPTLRSIGSPQEVIDQARNNLFTGAYNQSKQEIVYSHQNNELMIEQEFNFQQNLRVYEGMHAIFNYTENFAGQVQPLASHLYFFQIGDSIYKYRITHPINLNAENEINIFMENLIIHEST